MELTLPNRKSTLTLASNKCPDMSGKPRVAWLKPKTLLPTPKGARGSGLRTARNITHLRNALEKVMLYSLGPSPTGILLGSET